MKLEAIFRLPEMGGIIALFVGCGFGLAAVGWAIMCLVLVGMVGSLKTNLSCKAVWLVMQTIGFFRLLLMLVIVCLIFMFVNIIGSLKMWGWVFGCLCVASVVSFNACLAMSRRRSIGAA